VLERFVTRHRLTKSGDGFAEFAEKMENGRLPERNPPFFHLSPFKTKGYNKMNRHKYRLALCAGLRG
jgi:hypothetical protein